MPDTSSVRLASGPMTASTKPLPSSPHQPTCLSSDRSSAWHSAHGIGTGPGSFDSSTPPTPEKGDRLGLDRGHEKGVRTGQTVTNNHDNCPTIQSESQIHPDDQRIKAFWNRICSLATAPGRKMVPDSMWLSISYAHPDHICYHRTGMHGYSVGHSEMFILSSWIINIRSMDRS